MELRKILIPMVGLVQTIYCWGCFLYAPQLPYDDNYGILVHAIFVSIVVWVAAWIVRAWKRELFRLGKTAFLVWLFMGSPITFILAFLFYGPLFGPMAT